MMMAKGGPPDVEELKLTVAALETELASAREERESGAAEALGLRNQLEGAQTYAQEAALKYRQARLAAAPDVLPELVPETGDIAEIDYWMDTALRMAAQVKERAQQSQASQQARGPAGSPARRAADLSSLSASEKIRIGLERLADTSGR
jgi:hypothetical protein